MKFIKKSDILVISAILAVSLLTWLLFNVLAKSDGVVAEIYKDSQLVMTVELNEGEDRHFSVEGNPEVIFHITANGSISFEESDCPDKVCINAGELSKSGHFAACLPNGLVVRIKSRNPSDEEPDIIVGSAGGR